eukprot:Gb_40599 [translate_table: standard]
MEASVQFNAKKRKINSISHSDSGRRSLKVEYGFLKSETKDRSVTKNRTLKSFELNEIKDTCRVPAQHMLGRRLESYVAESSCSSVSSSESHPPHDFICSKQHGLSKSVVISDEDAESCSPFTNEKDKRDSSGAEQAIDVHMLELLAYRSVLKALRACGPLNWQREILLTDLRLSLHISNDEHRLELAKVCYAQDL